MTQDMNHTFVKVLRAVLVGTMMSLTGSHALAQESQTSTVTGVHVMGNVYGGGNLADVGGSVTVNMTAGTVTGDVYGGGALANTNTDISNDATIKTTVNLLGGTINGDAYGGGLGRQANNNVSPAVTAVEAKVYGDVKIYLNGMDKSFYDAADATMQAVFDTRITTDGAEFYLVRTDTKGAVVKRVFGANNKNGSPQRNVTVHVFGTQHKDAENILTKLKNANADLEQGSQNEEQYKTVLKGVLADMITKAGILNIAVTNDEKTGYQDIYNNTSSTADALKKAINDINNEINAKILDENTPAADIDALFETIYDVEAVYGGGNEAAYIPTTAYHPTNAPTGSKTQVIIEGCDETSIEAVYGGGNAASVPETNVDIVSAHEIQTVFGGGNGKDNKSDGSANPGADVGVYKVGETETIYGTGNATTRLIGGYFHEAYGASNSKGNIKGNISINTNPAGSCNLKYDKLVGAGKNADVDKDVIMILGCNPRTKNPLVFGGADNANVKGNVELTITSGNFGKVFGGNNEGGSIFGHIKLNIEETGGCETPITIDELYLGGNMAAYSQYGYYNSGTAEVPVYQPRTSASDSNTAVYFGDGTDNDHTKAPYAQPELNVISCTYIGKVFGGGYGTGATLYGEPIVNINMIQGSHYNDNTYGVPAKMTELDLPFADNPNKLGIIGDVFGGGNAADVIGNTTVNIGMATTVTLTSVDDDNTTEVDEKHPNVLGAYITGNVFGGGNLAEVSGNTYVNICGTQNPVLDSQNNPVLDSQNKPTYTDTSVSHSGTFAVSIGNSVYGGGNAADVLGNTFVTMADGYVFNGIFGGGLAGSVGTYTRDKSVTVFEHTANHAGCIGKPTECTAGGTCYVVVSGGQIGPVEVATQGEGMNRIKNGHCDPVPQGWVWGGGCGIVEDPSVPANQDTHFKAYVNNTDVTIKDNAFILESIIGGGEFGRVLGNTLVKIKGGQIGVGEGMVDNDGNPVRYTEAQFVDPTLTTITSGEGGNALAACSHFPYGKVVDGETVYDTYDPYADEYKTTQGSDKYPGGSTDAASDGKTWIGCVFAGGSGYMPVVKSKNANDKVTDYEWISSAGWVEGDAEVRISGGHILTNVYGGNEITSVQGKTTVTMTGGTIGVPRTREQVMANPMTGNLFGAGKGDPRSDFDTFTNVQEVEVNVSGGIIYGSVYGGSEDGHVLGNAVVKISGNAKIGTWGASYIDGNVYGGGMGSTINVEAGIIKGNTIVTIENSTVGENTVSPTVLHNVYGGGAYGSVGEFDYDATTGLPTGRKANTTGGIATIEITGGTIGTTGKENGMVFGSSRGDVGAPGEIHDKLAWVYDTHVTIGTSDATTGPAIKGSVYGSGENGHTYHDAEVIVHSGTIGITDTSIDGGAAYAYRGNVYGGGCGTDKYDSDNDHVLDSYNPLAGIVYGDATVSITGGQVVHNVYGAGAMGSVGTTDVATSGKTTIDISGGTIGVSGTVGDGNVFGAARGDEEVTAIGLAQVRETNVTISLGQVMGNVYGGGEVGNVGRFTNKTPVSVGNYDWDTSNTGSGLCTVTISGGKIGPDNVALSKEHGNVFGGGKGVSNTFECEKAMVYKTNVTISNGSTVNGTIYGGGEVGRVEGNTVVTIGTENGTDEPEIKGNVFAAGAGTKTHGYSALVRGTSSVTVQGKAKVLKNVYGGGEEASVGRYKVKVKNDPLTPSDAPSTLPVGMPYQLISGGTSTVIIRDNAVIGTDGVTTTGHVYGSGQGVDPHEVAYTYQSDVTKPSRMVSGNTWEYFADEAAYLQFVETLALTGKTDVTIDEAATIKGSVFGGSESGFVYHDTDVKINNGTIKGDAFGGGRGLATFAEAGRVSGNTQIAVSGGTVEGNVYGGGNLGDVGTIKKNTTNYNYIWKNSDSNGNINATGNDNAHNNNTITENNKNTGICKVTISGGTIGIDNPTDATEHGNVFGAGEGLATTWWCEKAIAYATNVSVTGGTVKGNIYGGGEVGRVEDDAKVTIGDPSVSDNLTITGSVFGAGAGLATHGYSALVRGNAEVTVQGKAQVGGSVYGGGEIASVGRFHVVGGLPKNPQAGGTCTVKIRGTAKIGTSGTGHNVFGACKGVTPAYDATNYKSVYSMQTYENRPSDTPGDTWDYYYTYPEGYKGQKFIKRYYKTEADYLDFLKTLALTSNTHVTVDGSSEVYGSVYGGGERGITLGGVDVNMTGGTVYEDVYGGGSLADSNTAMWDATNNTLHDYAELELIPGLSHVTGYYKGANHELVTDENAIAGEGEANSYSAIYKTNVNLTGGTIKGNAYGGGLGRKEYGTEGQNGYVSPIEAMVYGDVKVELNNNNNGGTADGTKPGCAVTRVFGCNNLNGTPKGKVKVFVYATQNSEKSIISDKTLGTYDVQAVYGGGNLAKYEPVDALLEYNETNKSKVDAARTEVIIDGCELTSIKQVYGGGNAASVPATFVEINGTYEIDEVFGGGNGADNYSLKEGGSDVWYQNPGANVGYYNYTRTETSGTSPGTVTNPYYLAIDRPDFDEKKERLPDPDTETAAAMRYGSGIARLEVYGGTIHISYGGSNSRGNVRTSLSSVYSANGGCTMAVGTSYGGGKDAISDGKVEMLADCAHGITEMFGGSMNADVDNDINLTITNGSTLERVFGGNNTSGAINGSITVTIDESGCEPIRIDNLYLGGYLAPYSVYGYKKTNGTYDYIEKADELGNAIQERIPLMKDEEGALETPHKDPCLYVISASHIGNIFGGGYKAKLVGNPHINVNMKQGKVLLTRTETEGADVYKDAMGKTYTEPKVVDGKYYATLDVGEIGNIYGGGNMADIIGDTYVEIGTGTWHNANGDLETLGTDGKTYTYSETTKKWSYKDDSGTHEADKTPTPARNAAKITGNVFGGGKGKADTFQCEKAMVGEDNSGKGSTNVIIGNGTVGSLDDDGKLMDNTGNVYGGGEIGRVEHNTSVTIGLEGDETNEPTIYGSVFGGGKGDITHGYSALVRGNPTVIIQGKAKVGESVYGGGEIASVGSFWVKGAKYPEGTDVPNAPEGTPPGMPYQLKVENSGTCTVTIRDNAEIGPDNMQMPDFKGHVFGAGKGILPKVYTYDVGDRPQRMVLYSAEDHQGKTNWNYVDPAHSDTNKNIWEYFEDEDAYIRFIETLAMTAKTEVTIEGNAFVKGSVYGGSENGHVLNNTHVMIAGGQIGNGSGTGKNSRFDWSSEDPSKFSECASWPYGKTIGTTKYYLPYDVYDIENGKPKAASDGHTFYGNVFGGGSGYFPYRRKSAKLDGFDWVEDEEKTAEVGQPVDANGYSDGVWLRSAGAVYGNTRVDITGGHILTSAYGGNECTDVGKYLNNSITPEEGTGTCIVNMTGGSIGVPRTVDQIKGHPVTCYLFGAGKGDQRINFNTWTNVGSTQVNISGTARIYGSTFGGGEDGHVLGDAETNIGGTVTITKADGSTENKSYSNVIIGTTGTSYVDGNIFGGGRGFSGDAQTAGTVGGNVRVNISNGTMLGSVYGGGRLASVGTSFEYPTLDNGASNPAYGNFKEDGNGKTYGHVTINITGGTIGNTVGNKESGNVFGGSMGRLELLRGSINPIWPKLAQVKTSTVNIYDGAKIKRSVYGGGELGTVRDDAYVTIGGYKTADADEDGKVAVTKSGSPTIDRDVYGGGYGSEDDDTHTIITVNELKDDVTTATGPSDYEEHTYAFTPMQFAGCVGQNTYVHICGGQVKKSVYGGGELASVGIINCMAEEVDNSAVTPRNVVVSEGTSKSYIYSNIVKHAPVKEDGKDIYYGFGLSWPYEFIYMPGFDGATHVHITGGRVGLKEGTDTNNFEDKDNGDVCGGGKGKAGDYNEYVFCANVGSTEVIIDYDSSADIPAPNSYESSGECIAGAVYGGAENGHVMGDTKLKLIKGLVGHSIYGGGSGKGTFSSTLLKIGSTTEEYTRNIYSITAGKVFGNTEIEMTGGTVVRNVYGGGNMGSVGKGNYSGGSDDYSAAGYGELPPSDNQALWTTAYTEQNQTKDFPWYFLHSGKCTVTIKGGIVGYINESKLDESMYPLDSNQQPYDASLPFGNVFGGCRGVSAPNIGETPRYLYCPEFFMGYANETSVTIGTENDQTDGPTIAASVYGGGMDGHIRRDASVKIYSGTIGRTYDETKLNTKFWANIGNVYGAGSGTGKYQYDFNYDSDFDDEVQYTNPQTDNSSTMKETDFSTSAGSVTRFAEVEVKGGTIHRNVYGGGSLSTVGAPKIPVNGILPPDPYRKGDTETGHGVGRQSTNEVTIAGGQIGDASSYDDNGNHVYGGYVFGASRGDDTLENPASFATAVWTDVNIKPHATDASKNPVIYGDIYGGGEVGTVRQSTDVELTGGTIMHDAYGGGRGTSSVAADVGADATITLNKDVDKTKKGCIVSRIFGCNNINGSPKGHATVHVYATQNKNKTTIQDGKITANLHTAMEEEGTATTYDVAAVYGGGNMSPYYPSTATESTESTEVIIDGCDMTSIKQVYGGGNAASTPATSVTVNGTYEIEELFGGGNGKDRVSYDGGLSYSDNPGANVGYKDYHLVESNFATKESRVEGDGFAEYRYGSGVAAVNVFGGLIHHVFGGSNTKGNVRKTALTLLEEKKEDGVTPCCPFQVDEVYGGGKSAPMDAEAILHMACIPGLKVAYGGAQEADVQDNVTLTITNGTFERVFGGNNISGTIRGSITVNIEETGCRPIIIGELYGGGNQAGYSVYGYKKVQKQVTENNVTTMVDSWEPLGKDPGDDLSEGRKYAEPKVNVKSFTSIGEVFGGGYGGSAVMVGDPTVNINEAMGEKASDPAAVIGKDGDNWKDMAVKDGKIVAKGTADSYPIPYHKSGTIGAINNVFGGGNAAKVVGKTTVNVGTSEYEQLAGIIAGETDVRDYYILKNGTYVKVSEDSGISVTAEADTDYYRLDGENYVKVTGITVGETDVKDYYTRSGDGTETSPHVYSKVPVVAANTLYYIKVLGADIRGNVYGGGNAADVTGDTNVVIGKEAPTSSDSGSDSSESGSGGDEPGGGSNP